MRTQFATNKTINGNQRNIDYYIDFISEELKRFSSYITRIEVQISDENSKKEGINDIRCVITARLGMQRIAIKYHANTVKLAAFGAIDELKASVKPFLKPVTNY